jgi:hypothetical protein
MQRQVVQEHYHQAEARLVEESLDLLIKTHLWMPSVLSLLTWAMLLRLHMWYFFQAASAFRQLCSILRTASFPKNND